MFARFFALLVLVHAAAAQSVVVEKVEGQESFLLESAAATGLSGLVWTGGETFHAVSDHKNVLVPLTLKIDPQTGRITSREVGVPIPVATEAGDFEGVAYVAATKAFYISAETGHAVLRCVPGQPATRLAVPPVFAKARANLSLESITWDETSKAFWIANEEALAPDGALAGPAAGSLVRLQRLDAKFRPTAQYAWRTEPATFRFGQAGSGVSDLCALPDGNLLVLERGFGAGGLHLRIFLADFKEATDTGRKPALDFIGAAIPARKIPLFDQPTGVLNYEGLALGPVLADGSRSLILIADSDGGPAHSLIPLKIRFAPPPAKPAR